MTTVLQDPGPDGAASDNWNEADNADDDGHDDRPRR
ncbi:Uncharacterised protein [Nocardia brasiliensis]|nr:Uncharacterised protein [Nocardia brasiliensis]